MKEHNFININTNNLNKFEEIRQLIYSNKGSSEEKFIIDELLNFLFNIKNVVANINLTLNTYCLKMKGCSYIYNEFINFLKLAKDRHNSGMILPKRRKNDEGYFSLAIIIWMGYKINCNYTSENECTILIEKEQGK